jgi:TPP-dependent pyruvate/acetoin dehydrogenase alpha subunit
MVVSSREFSGRQKDLLPDAGAQKLPIVFVTPGPMEDANRAAFKDALPVIAVDRDDAIAIDRVCQEATRRARQGHGPALIECVTCAAADGSSRDPISFLEDYMKQRRVWSDEWKRDLLLRFQAELSAF